MKTLKKATVLKTAPYGKRCEFQEWNGQALGHCGKKPFGKIWNKYVCKDHFDHVLAMKGIHKSEVLDERVEGGNYEPNKK
jgi:hypothetical protein